MSMPVKVKKWGSSMAVLIPGQFAKLKHIEVGSVIELESIEVLTSKRRYKASDLLAQFKPEHRHDEYDLGGPVGKEVW